MIKLLLLLMVYCFVGVHLASADTYPLDAVALRSLVNEWENLPPSWGKSNDPCGVPWEGVNCTGSRVTSLKLSSMNLKATTLGGDIGQLSELRTLDLSFNRDLTGSISPEIGNLKSLNILILAGCSFSGKIPDEIGNLAELSYLALNSNKFSGTIPPSLGKLSKLYWLDLSDNRLEGFLPFSTGTSPGLDMLIHTKHFHLNKNQLSGGISAKLLSSQMKLIHLLLDGNKLTGEIPDTLGYVSTLEVLRLDGNSLNGTVPSNLNNLITLYELNLANNQLTGSVPNLTGISTLNYVDLSNNSFNPSEAPRWFSTLESLTTLVMENGKLQGPVPQTLFSFPQLQQVKLKNNQFNDSLDLGIRVSQQLRLVDFEDNNISSVKLSSENRKDLILTGNPVCAAFSEINYCKQKKQQQQQQPDLANLTKCVSKLCLSTLMLNPRSCECALPYEGTLYFRAPFFSDLSNATVFNELETSLSVKLGLENDSVSLRDPFFNMDNYLQIHLYLFPHASTHFNRTEIQNLGFDLSNQTFKPPRIFGPYYFLADPYDFQDKKEGTSVSIGMIVGVAAGVILLIILIILAGVYAVKQRKRAERERERSRSFAPWAGSTNDTGDAPKLKGARWFSYDELKKSTNNFLDSNVIGSGGYGKVYRGVLSNGQLVAIKRAKQGSTQGGSEFKTEIELLSRVHHKNLVSLVGFCFEKREQMLVYEFIPNGTLRDSLSGRTGIYLDWRRRLRITLGSARGLAYLHELANPPIIHRDVKSSNILLDENLTAKVADFGLSKLVQDAKGHVSTQVKGTMGYLDPEYYMTQQLTEKSDVYSFGVVMLELVTAKQPIEKGKYIVREVQLKLDKNDKQHFGLQELMDPAMRYESSLIGLGRFIELAMQCVEESAAGRPTMNDLVKEIEAILHNDGMNSNSTSTSSDFFNMKGSHPYKDAMDGKGATGTSSDSFDYSGGYVPSTEVKPK